MRVLFLCTELSGYFVNCIQLFRQRYNCKITIIHYPSPSITPFEINSSDIDMICLDQIKKGQLHRICSDLQPTLLYVAGWVNKEYLRTAGKMKKLGCVIVCGMDNPWKASLRQILACILSPVFIKPNFHFIWVAGNLQYVYARRLGFLSNQILTGLYAADIDKFKSQSHLPSEHSILFVGRIEKVKGVDLLIDAFNSLTEKERKGWKLILIGNGSLAPKIRPSESVELYEFMQPEELAEFTSNVGAFILPSLHEPWGVVVQEFAAAAKPLLLSEEVNSGEKYLINNYNGFIFKSNSQSEIRKILVQFFSLDHELRMLMGQRSKQLALDNSPTVWVAKLGSLLKAFDFRTSKEN